MTATFDHRATGTSELRWRGGRLEELNRLSPPGHEDRLLVVSAHPDDESLGAGGLIATAAANGAQVSVLLVTDGEASHPDSPTHSRAQLAAIRRREVERAVRELGPFVSLRFLGIPDGTVSKHHDLLVREIAAQSADCTHLVTPWLRDRHPDHEACARAAAESIAGCPTIRHWQFPIWAWHWADPTTYDLPWSRLHRLDLATDASRAKQAAIGRHRSQHTALSDAPGDAAIVPEPVLAHFARDFECFVVEPPGSAFPAANSDYFDRLYAVDDDPWGLSKRFYELRKRTLILACLPRPRFRHAFEPGCSTGLLSVELAERCDELVAWDVAPAAVEQTRARLAGLETVQVAVGRIPEQWPRGSLDLIVLSEVGYYCPDLTALAARVRCSLARDGVVVACHWTRAAPDHPHTAGSVHEAIADGLHRIARHEEDDFRLDVFSRDPRSVAAREGIIQ